MDDALPKDFGRYRLLEKLATGGMAQIFLAEDQRSGARVVIKRILPNLAKSQDFVAMFLDEVRIAAQLEHPNIVNVRDVGRLEDTLYLAMDYVHGEDVRRIYNRAFREQVPLPLAVSIRNTIDAARGLAHAHAMRDFAGEPMGIIHRDVSPQNIIVGYDGHARLLDFGIAKAANKVATTKAGVLKGKYSYMSPEQARGQAVDARTDIFALGIILFETTTGVRLFKRETELATLKAIVECRVPRAEEFLPGYPPELQAVLDRALAPTPAQRFATGTELADALDSLAEGTELFASHTDVAAFLEALFVEPTLVDAHAASGTHPSVPSEAMDGFERMDLGGEEDTERRDKLARGRRPSASAAGFSPPSEVGKTVLAEEARAADSAPTVLAQEAAAPPAAPRSTPPFGRWRARYRQALLLAVASASIAAALAMSISQCPSGAPPSLDAKPSVVD